MPEGSPADHTDAWAVRPWSGLLLEREAYWMGTTQPTGRSVKPGRQVGAAWGGASSPGLSVPGSSSPSSVGVVVRGATEQSVPEVTVPPKEDLPANVK